MDDMEEGWYVFAKLETKFEIAVTTVQRMFRVVDGKQRQEGHVVEAHLYVAGIFSGSWIFKNPLDKVVAEAFIQSEEFRDGTSDGKASRQRTRWNATRTVSLVTTADLFSSQCTREILSPTLKASRTRTSISG